MLNPRHPVFVSIAGNDAFRNGLFKPPRVTYGIDALTDSDRPSTHAEVVEALTVHLEHCCVSSPVVVLEQRLIGPPQCAAYVRCRNASTSFDHVGICNDETISGD